MERNEQTVFWTILTISVVSYASPTNRNLTHEHSISIVPPFAGLQRFPEGRGFKEWTGDDSKALMKVSQFSLSIH